MIFNVLLGIPPPPPEVKVGRDIDIAGEEGISRIQWHATTLVQYTTESIVLVQ